MIFKQESIGVSVLDVLTLNQRNVKYENVARPFCALSFRYDSETVLQCRTRTYDVSNSVCYVPAGMDYTRISKRDNLIVIHFENHTYFSNKPEFFFPSDPAAYRALFEQAVACWNERGDGYRLQTAAILYEIFAMAYRENKGATSNNALVEQAVQMIEKNQFRTDFWVSEISDTLHISDVYLRRLFKEAFGTSPKQYLTQRRIRHAISLLDTHYYSVSEVAARCGFRDPKHFSTEFKRIVGSSPSEYAYSFSLSAGQAL